MGQTGLNFPRIALVRHPAVLGGDGRCYGRQDLPLADPGRDIPRLKAQLTPWFGATVWTSPLSRCRLVAEALGPEAILDHRLLELSFGAWEGLDWDDVPIADLDLWAANLLSFAAPGGETGLSLIHRVTFLWAELYALPGRHIIITHGGPLKVLTALAAGVDVDLAKPAPPVGAVIAVE